MRYVIRLVAATLLVPSVAVLLAAQQAAVSQIHDAVQSGADREEVATALPAHPGLVNQAQVRLVDQRRRLQGVALALARHDAPGQPAQLRLSARRRTHSGHSG